MPPYGTRGTKRARNEKAFAGLAGWARAMNRRPSRGGRALKMGSGSFSNALARVHVFKRVGQPLVITNSTAAARINIKGNADLMGGAGAPTATAGAFYGNTSQVQGAFRFCLAQASNITDVTNLFDNYRIAKVKLTFACSFNSAEPSAAVGPIPMINYCYDPDDNQPLPNREKVLENGYCVSKRMDKTFSVTLKPRAQQTVTGGLAAAGGMLPTNTWLDCDSTQIYHYGLKIWIDDFPYNAATSDLFGFTVTPTFYLEAKNVI